MKFRAATRMTGANLRVEKRKGIMPSEVFPYRGKEELVCCVVVVSPAGDTREERHSLSPSTSTNSLVFGFKREESGLLLLQYYLPYG